jgi:hypothetical protein
VDSGPTFGGEVIDVDGVIECGCMAAKNTRVDPNGVLTPWVKPRGGELSAEDRDANHLLSSLRMPVEHAIGRIKWWRAMRYRRRPADRFGTGGKAVAVLASML